MLGNFSRGMVVKIPARFQDNDKKPVPVENVLIRIEHFDIDDRKIVHDLSEQPMKQLSPSDYLYEYEIPQSSIIGTYTVYITAKIPNSKQKVFEALEQFNIITPESVKAAQELNTDDDYVQPKINYNQIPVSANSNNTVLKDFVVDVENKPLSGVHVNVYSKADFIPGDPNNIKLGSTMTNQDGEWQLELPRGEYVLIYKCIGKKENREFRKI